MSKITREELLAVFRRLVGRFGLDRVSMKELAREAGVSVGTIYRHFENKEALIASIEQTWLDHVRARDAEILEREGAAESKLYDLVVVHAARLSEMVRTDQTVFELLIGCGAPALHRPRGAGHAPPHLRRHDRGGRRHPRAGDGRR